MSSVPTRLVVVAGLLPLVLGCNLGRGGRSNADAFSARGRESDAPRFTSDSKEKTESGDSGKSEATQVAQMLERAHTAAGQRRFDVARSLYGLVVRSDPSNSSAHHGLAIIADGEGDHTVAEEHYLTALRGDPRNPDLLNDVGYSYLLQKRNAEAERYLRKALDLDPRHTLATSNLGHAVARRGDYDTALDLFRRVGTEAQAQAEIAKYTGNPRDPNAFARAMEREPKPAGDPFDPDLANLSPAEIRDAMERERLRAVAERQDRDRARFDHMRTDDPSTAPTNPGAGANSVVEWPASERWPGDPSPREFANEPAIPAHPPSTTAPDGLIRFDDPPTGGQRPSGGITRVGHESPAIQPSPPGTAQPRRTPDVWPADLDKFDAPPPIAPSTGTGMQLGFDDSFPSGNAGSTMPNHPGGLREEWGLDGTPARRTTPLTPAEARRRAALLGLGAGAGMPLTIEPGPTAGSPTFGPAVTTPPAVSPPPTEIIPAGGVVTPTTPGITPSAPASVDVPGWPTSAAVAPAPQPATGVQPIPTTSPVPSDPSLFRAADGTLHGAARPNYPPSAAETVRWQQEEIARQRAELERLTVEQQRVAAQMQADRRAFQGGGAPHPGFPADFAPPSRLRNEQ